ncbi:TonB-dependent siderophore receptor [Hydrogenophaga sp. OTU3427]|uniref:TonB-dependent siderophore receptor n=1 Tax=Hydrogenophaga sp. OTU3427 TaxID=3043856 RepID=UPI00313B63B4
MAHIRFRPRITSRHLALTPVAAVCAALLAPAAQAQTAEPTQTLAPVTVSEGNAARSADVAGLGDAPLARTPISATVIEAAQIESSGARSVRDLYKLDASVSDSYNAVGYWDYATVRGFVLDPKYNFRREGLPISAETVIGLENKERVEVFKGTSGIQAGTSAPGGLINYVVKRPTEKDLRSLRTEVTSEGGVLAHVDLGGRFGASREFGYRFNLAGERIGSHADNADGRRHLLALAMDWRISRDSLLEVEFEHSRRSQPGVPGLSLLGNQLPAANPFININNQPWSQDGVMRNFSGSVRFEQALATGWSWTAQLATQRLRADDRLAYPYGCYDAASGDYYADRYCPNGDYDLYDFRSDNERRTTSAAQLAIKGELKAAGLTHRLRFGLQANRHTDLGQPQADNNAAVGTGNIYTQPTLPADPSYFDPYTNLRERSTELFAYDAIEWAPGVQTWLGLRHTRLSRNSVRSDGSRATDYQRSATTPWLAGSWQLNPADMLYASWGQGLESEVAPGRSRYTNAGQPLPALNSRQWEFGFKHDDGRVRWNASFFDITRPLFGDLGSCDIEASCTRQRDGDARHRGIELGAGTRVGAWSLNASATALQARRRGSGIDPSLNGQTPTNVPEWILRASVGYRIAALPGLTALASLSHEGPRHVLPDGSVRLPSWTQVDAALRYETRLGNQPTTWTLGVDNLFNRRYFKEAPYQYSHVYLFPAAPRIVRLTLQTQF